MEHALGWIIGAVGLGVALGAAWAAFRAKGRTSLIDLMEQRIRIQDDEIERLKGENKVLEDRNRLLTNGFVDRIVTAVVRVLRDRRREGGMDL